MRGKHQGRLLRSSRAHRDTPCRVVLKPVVDGSVDRAWEALVSIGVIERELDPRGVEIRNLPGGAVVADCTAVQRVDVVLVEGRVVGRSIELERAVLGEV